MASERIQDEMVREHLHAIGLELLIEWDTLVFLYHRSASLATVVQIARFIGYDTTATEAALHKLPAPAEPGRHSCLLELMKTAQIRTGRLLLVRHLKRPCQEPPRRRHGGLRLA